jgi:AraC-like DNA-binding protein
MTVALNMLRGDFGRVALLDMNKPLVRHAHPQSHVLIKVGGSDQAFIVDGQECVLADDTAVLVNTWCEHYYPHNEAAGDCVFLVFYIEPGWLGRIDDELILSRHPGFFPSPCVRIGKTMQAMAQSIAEELVYDRDLASERVESLVFDLMIEMISGFSLWRDRSESRALAASMNDYRIRRALKHLHGEHGRTCDVNDLISIAGLSRPRFFELFKEQTGVTPVVYANALRVESAMDFLGRSDAPIVDVSLDHGFEEQSNFTRFFRQHIGIPPAAYRRVVTEYGGALPT